MRNRMCVPQLERARWHSSRASDWYIICSFASGNFAGGHKVHDLRARCSLHYEAVYTHIAIRRTVRCLTSKRLSRIFVPCRIIGALRVINCCYRIVVMGKNGGGGAIFFRKGWCV